ncbi:MAG: DUF4197 domain-containing protein [Bacteroidetes bacterium]|nr:DUF4197 domain-containing protein [Bacteroidota bacterium]
MKIHLILCLSLSLSVVSCDVLQEAGDILASSTTAPALSNEEVIKGLKEALNVGIKNSVNLTSVSNGFLDNANIRLPFPEDALKLKEKALEWGLDDQVSKFESTLNHAAEEATKQALPIFVNAIQNMSVQDGFNILNGGNGAATNFLKNQTLAQLKAAFLPKVNEAIAQVKLTEYWNPLASKYNSAMSFTGGQKVTTDLSDYVTDKAINGLFFMVEQEENKIRQNPAARVTDLLQKVFGAARN